MTSRNTKNTDAVASDRETAVRNDRGRGTRSVGRALAEEPRPHNGKAGGALVHRVIGRLGEAGVRDPTPEQLLQFTAAEPLLDEPHVYLLARRQCLLAGVAIYQRLFAPEQPPWRLLEWGVPVPGSDLDLVFEHADGRVRSDELKTGGAPALADARKLEEQVTRQIQGGRERYGRERFVGVRVLFLAAPARSFAAVPVDGGGFDRIALDAC